MSNARSAAIDKALVNMAASREPGRCYSYSEIGVRCGCSGIAIKNIEAGALAKLAKALRKCGVDRTVLASLTTDASSYAVRTPRVESV